MRFTDVRYVGWKKIGWAVFEKNSFFHFWGLLKIFWGLQNLIWHQKPQLWGWGGGGHTSCSDKRILEVPTNKSDISLPHGDLLHWGSKLSARKFSNNSTFLH